MQYDLVFEGGGAKGTVFVGAMQVFESLGHTHGRLLGTSAGAITAAFLAAGYTSAEMLEALAEKKDGHSIFADFMSVPPSPDEQAIRNSATRQLLRQLDLPFLPERFEERLEDQLLGWLAQQDSLRCVFSFVEQGGWYSADNFMTWLKRKLDGGMDRGKPRQYSALTLKEFYETTGRDVSLVTADTTQNAMLVLNHRTAPDLPLVWAVRMSMSLPLVWQEVVWQPEWGRYRDRPLDGHSLVDGGLLSNFPIELFVSRAAPVVRVMGPDPSQHVLGLLIDESLSVPGADNAHLAAKSFSLGELRTVQRLSNLVNTATSARDKSVIEAVEELVVRLPAKGYGTTEFDMSDERRELLVEAGRQAMQAYFDRAVEAVVSFGPPGEDYRARRAADRIAQKMLE
jgi:predicted acylesterase/phospholipase RssA